MSPPRVITLGQLAVFVDYAEQKPEILFRKGQPLPGDSQIPINEFWNEISRKLNSFPVGAKKTTYGWRRYWHRLKSSFKTQIYTDGRRLQLLEYYDKHANPLYALKKRLLNAVFENTNNEDSSPEVEDRGEQDNNESENDVCIVEEDTSIQGDDNMELQFVEVTEESTNNLIREDENETSNQPEDCIADRINKLLDSNDKIVERSKKDRVPLYKLTPNGVVERITIPQSNVPNKEVRDHDYISASGSRAPKRKRKNSDSNLISTLKLRKIDISTKFKMLAAEKMELVKLQKELVQKQLLVEEERLLNMRILNEVAKRQLQEETKKIEHNNKLRTIEMEQIMRKLNNTH